MQIFNSPVGTGILWFDNLATSDGTPVAYDPRERQFRTDARTCANRDDIGCNWMASAEGPLCQACVMTEVIPDLSTSNARANWGVTEAAKRWVLDNLGRWKWFGSEDSGALPKFHLLAEGSTPVTIGHIEGVVTISVAEADPVVRVQRREAMEEPYRTMHGHMRHEIAHALWWRLSLNQNFLDTFRATFGDEREDYQAALERHYSYGPPEFWNQTFLTRYASAHPHEDWAETVAHLLHLTDIADSFSAADLRMSDSPGPGWDPYAEPDTAQLISTATLITIAVNHVNRSMGLVDLYPFVLSDAARNKLAFTHQWLRRGPQKFPPRPDSNL